MTPRQKELYEYIVAYFNENGCSPTYVEMADHLGVQGVSTPQWLVNALVKQGKLEKGRNSHRSILLKDWK